MAEQKTILSLDDDCLLQIFSLLYTREHMKLKRVCQRFTQVVNTIWSVKFKTWTRTMYDYSRQNFSIVPFHLREFIELLDLGMLQVHEADLILQLVFPKTRSLAVNLEPITESVSLEILTNVFPNLTALTLEAHIDMDKIAQLQNVAELHVEYKRYSGMLHFGSIFTSLKLRKFSFNYCDRSEVDYDRVDFETILQCKTLETIGLNALFLDYIVTKLSQLPKLAFISCYSDGSVNEYIFEKTVDLFGPRIVALTSVSILSSFPLHKLQLMPKLRKLVMQDVRVLSFEQSELNLKNLQELQIHGTSIIDPLDFEYDYENEVMRLGCKDFIPLVVIAACENLETLGIPRDWLNNEIKLDELCALWWIQKNKNSRLHVKCYNYICRYYADAPFVHPDDVEKLARDYKEMLHITLEEYEKEDSSIFVEARKMFEIGLDTK